ncbi:uncharacterized protein (DUF302 family) [Christiangramia gaetbulicola]|uniref:Uncharacterized protein (DUF302 family) n=1 Tax=Christiangramia gaetbulicola TaxID=703340 RepID=A0A2T6AIA2_9FLAO|nr:DUF302 domain-containing protein [Christiangramia gaetbulicola]PTX43522.1 uncharacterized protein (DUF302 family) [Christiangramia gaetbulicola]
MDYYYNRKIKGDFDDIMDRTKKELEKEGFGVLTEINVNETFKKKLDVDFRRYHILGACNAPYAYKAIGSEDKIGTMLPCNVILQQINENEVEVAAVNPLASMQAVENSKLNDVAQDIAGKLQKVVQNI